MHITCVFLEQNIIVKTLVSSFLSSYAVALLINTQQQKMAKKINVEKILKEFSKGAVDLQVEAFSQIKLALTDNLKKKQEEIQALSNSVNGQPTS